MTLVAFHDIEWVKGLRNKKLEHGLNLECLFLKFLRGRSWMTQTGRNVAGWNGSMTDASFNISLTLTQKDSLEFNSDCCWFKARDCFTVRRHYGMNIDTDSQNVQHERRSQDIG